MRNAFTLIELLVVIAILAVLAVVVVLVLNPAGLLQEARDHNRLSDMDTLSHALSIYSADVISGSSLGQSNTVYVSIPDPAATSTAGDQCQGLGLVALPSSYTYQCAAPAYYRLTNGTGWIPVNLGQTTFGTPLSQLPIDPTNSSSSRLYYTYTTNGTQFEVTATMESSKYKLGGTADVISNDGGTLATVYERGSKLGLEPLDYGDASLVGLWTFDEGAGAIAYDYSGSNATGSWGGTQAGTSGYYSAGRVGPWAGFFNGVNNHVRIPTSTFLMPFAANGFSITVWANTNATSVQTIAHKGLYGNSAKIGPFQILTPNPNTSIKRTFSVGDDNTSQLISSDVNSVTTSTWQFWSFTYNGTNISIYLNGALNAGPTAVTVPVADDGNNGFMEIGERSSNGGFFFNGLLDDFRIYSRSLSAAEIQAMYNGGK